MSGKRPASNRLKTAVFIHKLKSENWDDPELAQAASEFAQLHLEGGWSFDDAELFRRILREIRHNPRVEDPVTFAVRKVEVERALAFGKPAATFRRARKAAKRTRAKAEAELERVVETASKSAGSRTSLQRDLEYVHILGEAERKDYLHRPHSVGLEIKRRLKTYKAPHYDHITVPLRVLTWSIIVHEEHGAFFTLHLGEEMNERAFRSGRGPASFIQEQIKDELEKRWGGQAPAFWFSVETEDDGTRLHVHGGILNPASGSGKDVWEALSKAGGKWAARSGAIHQVDLTPLHGPYNLASYVLKEFNATRRALGRRTVAASRGMTTRTEARWTDLRSALPSV